MQFLPAKRSITPEDESHNLLYKEVGLSSRQIVRVIELENNIQHGTLPFLDRDIRNLFVKVKKKLAASATSNSRDGAFIMMTNHKVKILNSKSPLEEQVSRALTPFAFKKFQEEFGRTSLYSILYMSNNEFDGQIAKCSCKNFKFWEILCHHILRVFLQKDCHEIPSTYLPLRWCQENEKDIDPSSQTTHSFGIENIVISLEVEREDEVLCPPRSTSKGLGYTAPRCPMKESIWEAARAIQKKKKTSASDLGLNPMFCVKN
ncbi:hypothetical protein Cgig2_002921 [Carnegiea gigantea]|uniref:Protein FAR1-RELATED SEQUENCE n=1 Tax=Carnegiea gigantea TaxID=171969 RepID=A0A9Q1JHF2_9CARY|nr:hypothetical protein Cgig2_002920 [Carnegiea gigantea]KAJ8422825.1 hypothetical protein Cgig2_002921 [Carnegiea gigantea]